MTFIASILLFLALLIICHRLSATRKIIPAKILIFLDGQVERKELKTTITRYQFLGRASPLFWTPLIFYCCFLTWGNLRIGCRVVLFTLLTFSDNGFVFVVFLILGIVFRCQDLFSCLPLAFLIFKEHKVKTL